MTNKYMNFYSCDPNRQLSVYIWFIYDDDDITSYELRLSVPKWAGMSSWQKNEHQRILNWASEALSFRCKRAEKTNRRWLLAYEITLKCTVSRRESLHAWWIEANRTRRTSTIDSWLVTASGRKFERATCINISVIAHTSTEVMPFTQLNNNNKGSAWGLSTASLTFNRSLILLQCTITVLRIG